MQVLAQNHIEVKNKASSHFSSVKNPVKLIVPSMKQPLRPEAQRNLKTFNASHADQAIECNHNSETVDGNEVVNPYQWQVVQRKHRRQMVKGSRSSNIVLKSVEENRNFYVGRYDKNVSTDDIVKYIRDEINIEPLNCDMITKPILPAKSFRVSV